MSGWAAVENTVGANRPVDSWHKTRTLLDSRLWGASPFTVESEKPPVDAGGFRHRKQHGADRGPFGVVKPRVDSRFSHVVKVGPYI